MKKHAEWTSLLAYLTLLILIICKENIKYIGWTSYEVRSQTTFYQVYNQM